MKKSNDASSMNPEDFEKQLKRQPVRPVPVEWRAEILAAANVASVASPAPRPTASLISTLNSRLSALLWPCPQAWAGLAAVWLVIFAVNYSMQDNSGIVASKSPPSTSPEAIMVLQEQRKLLANLMAPYDESPAEPPKPFIPRPRGELSSPVGMA